MFSIYFVTYSCNEVWQDVVFLSSSSSISCFEVNFLSLCIICLRELTLELHFVVQVEIGKFFYPSPSTSILGYIFFSKYFSKSFMS